MDLKKNNLSSSLPIIASEAQLLARLIELALLGPHNKLEPHLKMNRMRFVPRKDKAEWGCAPELLLCFNSGF